MTKVSKFRGLFLRSPGACFLKVPKLFGRISGRLILFVSSKRRRLEARNFAVILIFIPFTTYEKTSLTEKAGRSFTNGFSGISRNGLPGRVRGYTPSGKKLEMVARVRAFWRHYGEASLSPVKVNGETFWSRSQQLTVCRLLYPWLPSGFFANPKRSRVVLQTTVKLHTF